MPDDAGRCAVEQLDVADDLVENVPDLGTSFPHLLALLMVVATGS
jgi:hypothetical protein